MKSFFFLARRSVKITLLIYLFTFFIGNIFLTGCAPTPIFIKSDYDQKQIKSIAVMPVTDKRILNEDTIRNNENLKI